VVAGSIKAYSCSQKGKGRIMKERVENALARVMLKRKILHRIKRMKMFYAVHIFIYSWSVLNNQQHTFHSCINIISVYNHTKAEIYFHITHE
jgi:hypothetical protein